VERAIEEEILRAKKRRLRELLRKALESAEITEEWVKAVEGVRAER